MLRETSGSRPYWYTSSTSAMARRLRSSRVVEKEVLWAFMSGYRVLDLRAQSSRVAEHDDRALTVRGAVLSRVLDDDQDRRRGFQSTGMSTSAKVAGRRCSDCGSNCRKPADAECSDRS